jgi:apolipoprotein N-acyltransferase
VNSRVARRNAALAVAGAALMSLAAAPTNLWPLGLFAWVPLALIAASGDVAGAALAGWLQGTLAQASVLASVPAALHAVARVSWPASVGLYAFLAAFEGARHGVVALLAARSARHGRPLVLTFPLALTTTELVFPMVFPWTTSLLLSGAPVLLQAAEAGGRLGISLWVALLDASVATAWLERRDRRLAFRYAVVLPGLTLTVVAVFGIARMRAVDGAVASAPAARVGIVQGDIPDVRREQRDPAILYREASLGLLTEQNPDLLVWPETAIFYATDYEDLSRLLADRVFHDAARATGHRIDVPILTGLVIRRTPPESPAHVRVLNADGTIHYEQSSLYNSAVLATPDGRIRGMYDKRSLVPIGEYLPAEKTFPWLRRLLPWAGRFSPGASSAPILFGARRILVSICYEDVLAGAVRDAVDRGDPDLLVNLTSDAWFDRSRIPFLHLELAKLRAIEHRRFLIHATNTGVSAVVDPAGRIVLGLAPSRLSSAVTTVRWMRSRTVYEAVGDAPFYAAGTLMFVMVVRRRRRSSPALVIRSGDAHAE